MAVENGVGFEGVFVDGTTLDGILGGLGVFLQPLIRAIKKTISKIPNIFLDIFASSLYLKTKVTCT
jgi:hypothetical protein